MGSRSFTLPRASHYLRGFAVVACFCLGVFASLGLVRSLGWGQVQLTDTCPAHCVLNGLAISQASTLNESANNGVRRITLRDALDGRIESGSVVYIVSQGQR